MSASFVPDHKASMVLFLDRVYGIDNQDFLLHVLEVGFLPDMRAAASLDTVRRKRQILQVLFSTVFHSVIIIIIFFFNTGCVQYYWNGLSTEPLPLFSRSASAHQVRPAVCRDRPPGHYDRLHAPHHLSFVPRSSPYQGPERCHWGVPHVTLQVSVQTKPILEIQHAL